MNKEQFLLMKLAEECTEVGQRAIKSMQYGSQQVWKGNEVPGGLGPANAGLDNAQRLTSELMDLAIIADLLTDLKAIVAPEDSEYQKAKKTKIANLNKYLAFSRELGVIDGDWTI